MKSVDKRPLKVFLCHAHADRDPVRGLYTRLAQDGVDAWLDKAKLLPGQDWELEIRKAVREADVVVVCLSKQFNQAGFRQKEVRLALDTAMEKPEGEIFIIPARLDECDNLESLRKWHEVDLFEDEGYELLIRSLRARADKIGSTLQIKKKWLPNVMSQRPAPQKPSVINQPFVQEDNPGPRLEVIKPKRKLNLKQLIGRVGLVFLGVLSILTLVLSFWKPPSQTDEPTFTAVTEPVDGTQVNGSSFLPVEASGTSSLFPTQIDIITLTSLPTKVADAKGVKMALIPAGTFTMGSENYGDNEKPVHQVYLDSYYMDIYEVTIASYKMCVENGACQLPSDTVDYNDAIYAQHPVIYVDWNQAKNYCEWRDARLPTEAEWEKAARDTDQRTYPWGEESANGDRANIGRGEYTEVVGSYESGKSPYGMYDMVGNIWEWTSSLYQSYPYDINDGRENMNSSGDRVVRGGKWGGDYYVDSAHSSYRVWFALDFTSPLIGIRCARDANP